jgi:Anticodon-binding domain
LLIHDPTSETIILSSPSRPTNGVETPPSTPYVDLQIVKISTIKDIRVLGQKQPDFKPYEAKPISVTEIKAREELAFKKALEEEKRFGVGVTVEGQKIYDAFAKTYFPRRGG